jgi:hypothetical protein
MYILQNSRRVAEKTKDAISTRIIREEELDSFFYQNRPKIVPVLILIDPYKPANPNGGGRKFALKHLRKDRKKLVVVATGDECCLMEAKNIIQKLVGSNWQSNVQTST